METLAILEERITQLIDLIKELKAENTKLLQEKDVELQKNEAQLQQIALLETSLLKNSKNMDELNQETEATKKLVDGLIKNIDSLVS